jgi:hypothetical protein
MSATTESLMEQVEELRILIASKEILGEDTSELKQKLNVMQKKLITASQSLNENKVLKG